MEDINSIKTYIQNNYPNMTVCGDGNCFVVTNDPQNSEMYKKIYPEEYHELVVKPYDPERDIYEEIYHGFLVKVINEEICCCKKLVSGKGVNLTNTDKTICGALGIKYREF